MNYIRDKGQLCMMKQEIHGRILKAIHENADSQFVFIYDYETQMVEWSREASDFFGFPQGPTAHFFQTLEHTVHPDDKEKCDAELNRVLAYEQGSFYKSYHMKNKDGDYLLCRGKGKVYCDDDGKPMVFAGTVTVCDEEVSYDSVSGLQTVNGFSNTIHRYNEMDREYMVMMLEIHHFHDVNALYGYDFGNKVLYQLSNIFRDLLKGSELGHVYRIEGTTFVFVIKGRDLDSVKKMYEQIRELTLHFLIDEFTISMDMIGAVWYIVERKPEPQLILSSLISVLERIKANETYELVVYDDNMKADMSQSLELLNTIKNSIRKDCEGFFLCYQPFVSTLSGKVIGAEALLRWQSAEYGVVGPYRFIPYLESHPCFYELGLWIIRQAVSDAKKIREKCPNFFVNVNMSYSQIQSPGFKEEVVAILDSEDFPRTALQLELTERCRNLDLTFLQQQLQFFREEGIKIALDDFGTGTSTIELLCNLPVDCVKIDQSYIRNILVQENNKAIVDATMQCTRRLGIDVCLEGVENEEVRDFVEQYSANYHQGYFYAKPVVYDEFIQFLDKSWQRDRINVIRENGKSRFDVSNILAMIPGGFFIYIAGGDERITCANEALLRMFECKNAEDFYELTGNRFKGIVHPDDYEKVEACIKNQITRSEDKLDYVKYRIITRTGKVKWVNDYGRLVKNEHDEDVFYVFLGDSRRTVEE